MPTAMKDGAVMPVSWPSLLDALSDKERNQAILEVAFPYKRLREVPLELLQCGGVWGCCGGLPVCEGPSASPGMHRVVPCCVAQA